MSPPDLPEPRAMARAPKRVTNQMARSGMPGGGARRRTVVNPNPDMIRRSMTADLGGRGVVLGG